MSESEKQPLAYESQSQRWVKYGGNVLLTSVVVLLLAIAVTALAERKPRRIDTTAAGLYSLKPQTVNLVRDLKSPVKVVSLYTRSKPAQNPDQDSADETAKPAIPPEEAAQTVDDLLDEYASKGRNISVESIDPVTSPAKVDALIEQVEAKYGGEVGKYKSFVEGFKETLKQFSDLATPEAKAVTSLPLEDIKTRDQAMAVRLALVSVRSFPQSLDDLQESLRKPLKQRPPDYKGAADSIKDSMSTIATVLDRVVSDFTHFKDDKTLPPAIAGYMRDSLPKYQQLKKLADDTVAKGKELGELKLDTLRTALRERNTILVMGDKEWRIIRYDQVWRAPAKSRVTGLDQGVTRPRFAGEQQVTGAILAVTSTGPKPKVCFVRAGGQPLASSMNPFAAEAPLADVADRLGLYNFEVMEKDVTGQYAMQAQSQGMPAPPEPTDDQIKDAVWVVLNTPSRPNPMTGEPGQSVGPALAAHLKEGGSALVLSVPNSDNLADALSGWGVEAHNDAVAVHKKLPPAEGEKSDLFDQVFRYPFVFQVRDYGDHPLAAPLRSLEGLLPGATVVRTSGIKDGTVTPLIPIPAPAGTDSVWGETDLQSIDEATQGGPWPKYDAGTDLPAPLFAGAAVDRNKLGRLVVIGSLFCSNDLLRIQDPATTGGAGAAAARFPGNGELFMNSVFWLAKMDSMIDISPAAMEVSRIKDMSPGTLKFWRVGVLMIGLPMAVLLAGGLVYLGRRD